MPGDLQDGEPAAWPVWWYLPNWLGLDSPTVVLAWTWMAGRRIGLDLPLRIGAGLFFFVWSIYLADRLIDVARCPDWSSVPGRLQFGRHHRSALWTCLAGSLGVTAILATALSGHVLHRLLWATPGVAGYFLIFVAPVLSGRKLPGKEFAVGFFCALPPWVTFGWDDRFALLLPLYALLVTLNCLVIAARERDLDGKIDPGAATAWWPTLEQDLPKAGIGLAVIALLLALSGSVGFLAMVALAAIALTGLHWNSRRLPSDAVRALADGCLLVPVVLAGCAGR